MGSTLVTIMLVCFGFSWPINLIKAYKSKTAKSTSLPFILLITAGYVAVQLCFDCLHYQYCNRTAEFGGVLQKQGN